MTTPSELIIILREPQDTLLASQTDDPEKGMWHNGILLGEVRSNASESSTCSSSSTSAL